MNLAHSSARSISTSARVTDSTPLERAMSKAAAEPIIPAPMTSSFIRRWKEQDAARGLCAPEIRKCKLGSVNEDHPSAKYGDQPMPKSSAASSGVPQRRQITAEQSPHVRGSITSRLHC